jgi:hypothetical protein
MIFRTNRPKIELSVGLNALIVIDFVSHKTLFDVCET